MCVQEGKAELEKMDKNKDGKADLEELKGYMKAVTSIATLHCVRRTMDRCACAAGILLPRRRERGGPLRC